MFHSVHHGADGLLERPSAFFCKCFEQSLDAEAIFGRVLGFDDAIRDKEEAVTGGKRDDVLLIGGGAQEANRDAACLACSG